MRNNLIIESKRARTVVYTPTQEELDREAEKAAATAAQQSKNADALANTPASVNSVPALRAEVNKIKAYLRGE